MSKLARLGRALGSIDGRILTCGFHYAKFDITDGRPLSPPADKPLRKFRVILREDEIFVDLEE